MFGLHIKFYGLKVLQLHKNLTFWQSYENVHPECKIELFSDFCSSIFPKFVDFGNNILLYAFFSCCSTKIICHLSAFVNIVAKELEQLWENFIKQKLLSGKGYSPEIWQPAQVQKAGLLLWYLGQLCQNLDVLYIVLCTSP